MSKTINFKLVNSNLGSFQIRNIDIVNIYYSSAVFGLSTSQDIPERQKLRATLIASMFASKSEYVIRCPFLLMGQKWGMLLFSVFKTCFISYPESLKSSAYFGASNYIGS